MKNTHLKQSFGENFNEKNFEFGIAEFYSYTKDGNPFSDEESEAEPEDESEDEVEY